MTARSPRQRSDRVVPPALSYVPPASPFTGGSRPGLQTFPSQPMSGESLPIDASVDEHRPARSLDGTALPIVVGVTGHRMIDAAHVASLERTVGRMLGELRRDYPSSPLTVLSPLAEGADRLVARVALEAGAHLVVPLPFEYGRYVADFTTEESRAEFDALLARASRHFVLPLLEGHDLESMSVSGHSRDLHYAQVGAYIARSCQVMIALWDGHTKQLHGGTADVVLYCLHGAPPVLTPGASPLDAPQCRPVYHVATPSSRGLADGIEPLEGRMLRPDGYASDRTAQDALRHLLERIDGFNRDERRLHDRLAAMRERSRQYIAPQPVADVLDDDQRAILERYVVADSLALHYRRRSSTGLLAIVVGVFIAVAFFEIYGHMAPETHWLLVAYLVGLLGVWLVQRRVRRGDYQTKHLDYRALAEGLRVQLFWRIAGIREGVADHYMRKQRSVLDWIRTAIETWSIGATEREEARVEAHLDVVARHWVADQSSYFRGAAHHADHLHHRLERIVDAFFGSALVIALLHLVNHLVAHEAVALGHVPILAIGVCLLTAGVLHGYIGRRALPELSKQFAHMATVFATAHDRLESMRASGDSAGARALLTELGIEALSENGDWLILHRERPLEMPRGH